MTRMLTPAEAAERLARPVRTLGQWRYLGRGPKYARIEGTIRYPEDALEEWIAGCTINPADEGGHGPNAAA